MATTKTALKQYFKKYATPTEAQFAELIDAFVHKDEDSITQDKIDGLTAALNSKVSSQDLSTAVAAAVAETLQGGNFEVTPAAHEHAVSDISGLGARLTTLETSKADYEAFKTLVTAFLNDADVSDTTINRWKELEDFLSGITDSDTLAGMLQALKAEILAEVPQPQTGNYLEQVTDMAAALQTAEVGKIVQYVGQSDAEYTRGLCYEKKEGETLMIPQGTEGRRYSVTGYGQGFDTEHNRDVFPTGRVFDGYAVPIYNNPNEPVLAQFVIGEPAVGNYAYMNGKKEITSITTAYGDPYYYVNESEGPYGWTVPIKIEELVSIIGDIILRPTKADGTTDGNEFLIQAEDGVASQNSGFTSIQAEQDIIYGGTPSSWQPIITSPAVS